MSCAERLYYGSLHSRSLRKRGDDDVSVDVEVVALCGSERRERTMEVGSVLCGCHEGILPYPAMSSERTQGALGCRLCRNDARGWLRPDVEGTESQAV